MKRKFTNIEVKEKIPLKGDGILTLQYLTFIQLLVIILERIQSYRSENHERT
jgi:hypothetical protein